MSALVSIVIPVYKTEQFIERCLKSICEQTLENFQIIIVDDCSPDNAIQKVEQILDLYPNRLAQMKIIRLEENVGLASARKIAFKYIEGKYVTCLDSDDYIELNALEFMLNKIEETQADVVVCDYYVTYPDKELIVYQKTSTNTYMKQLLENQLHSSYCNKMYKKELLNKTEILDGVNMCEDFLFAIQVGIYAKKIEYLNKPFLHYVQYNSNAYTQNYTEKSIKDIISIVNFSEQLLKKAEMFDQYKNEFFYRKLFFKVMILIHSQQTVRNNYLNIYQELNYLISQMPLYYKIILNCAKMNSHLGINFFVFLKKWITELRRVYK